MGDTTYTDINRIQARPTHCRRSAARRASLPSSLPTSSPGKGGVEETAWSVASAAATPVKGIPTPPVAALSGAGGRVLFPTPDPAIFAVSYDDSFA